MSSGKRHHYKNLKIWKSGIEIVGDVFSLGLASSFELETKEIILLKYN